MKVYTFDLGAGGLPAPILREPVPGGNMTRTVLKDGKEQLDMAELTIVRKNCEMHAIKDNTPPLWMGVAPSITDETIPEDKRAVLCRVLSPGLPGGMAEF